MNKLSLLVACLFTALPVSAEDKVPAPAAATEVKHVDGKGAKTLLETKATEAEKITIVDVRTPEEYAAGHIAGAKNIDIASDTFEAELNKLDKTKPILVHCGAGGRSTTSLSTFKKLGFKTVTHLDGGMKAWKAAGNPVETKTEAAKPEKK
jgi:rhodanese-related sulfurtransferase